MSTRHTPQRLGTLLRAVIADRGYQQGIDEARAIGVWEELVGAQILGAMDGVWVKEGRLHVRMRSAVWRHHLHLQREAWRQRLNAELGREVITEIVFR